MDIMSSMLKYSWQATKKRKLIAQFYLAYSLQIALIKEVFTILFVLSDLSSMRLTEIHQSLFT